MEGQAAERSDVRIEAGPDGQARVLVDGADVSRWVTALGLDVLPSEEETRLVLEGAGRLEGALQSLEIGFRRIPALTGRDLELLEAAASAFEPDGRRREAYLRLVERLKDMSQPAT